MGYQPNNRPHRGKPRQQIPNPPKTKQLQDAYLEYLVISGQTAMFETTTREMSGVVIDYDQFTILIATVDDEDVYVPYLIYKAGVVGIGFTDFTPDLSTEREVLDFKLNLHNAANGSLNRTLQTIKK